MLQMNIEREKKRRMLMTIGEDNKSEKIHKVDITDYQDVADCIRSDQVPANHIAEYFSDKKFYQWYKKKYLND